MIPHFHIDIETLDTRPTSVILSIGVVEIDFASGRITREMHVNIDPDDCEFYGLTTDQETIDWWAEQSKEAKARTFNKKTAVELKTALLQLNEFVGTDGKEVSANGITFDISILENAYAATGVPVPWDYQEVMDTRTLRNWFTEIGRGEPPAAQHDALVDATWQGEHLIRMYEHTKTLRQALRGPAPVVVDALHSDMVKGLAMMHNYIETLPRATRPFRIAECYAEWNALKLGKPPIDDDEL